MFLSGKGPHGYLWETVGLIPPKNIGLEGCNLHGCVQCDSHCHEKKCAANMRMSVASVFMLKFLDVRVSLLLFGSARKARQAKKKAQTDRNRGR